MKVEIIKVLKIQIIIVKKKRVILNKLIVYFSYILQYYYDVINPSNMRKTIAKRLQQSKIDFPHSYINIDINVLI